MAADFGGYGASGPTDADRMPFCAGHKCDPWLLETLPMPIPAIGPPASTPAKAGDVGYGKPPRHTRWQKGCKSPNPKGRPPSPALGPYTSAFAKKVGCQIDGRRKMITRREALDRKVRQMAAGGSHAAQELWQERIRLEEKRAQLAAAARMSAAAETRPPMPKVLRQGLAMNRLWETIDRHLPGLFEALSTLTYLGLVRGFKIVEDAAQPIIEEPG